jgi:hypothetical protein
MKTYLVNESTLQNIEGLISDWKATAKAQIERGRIDLADISLARARSIEAALYLLRKEAVVAEGSCTITVTS